METTKLRKLQQPSETKRLLESLLTSLNRPPPGAGRITDPSELPMALRRLAIRASKEGGAWAAWLFRYNISFCTVEVALDLARERGQPALKITIYDERGRVQEWGLWAQSASGVWQAYSL